MYNGNKALLAWIEAAIVAALAMALSFIPDYLSWMTPSYGAIIAILFALRRGAGFGLLSGLLWGLLHFLTGKAYFMTIPQVLIEYVLAFTCIGFAGVVSGRFRAALRENRKASAIFFAICGTVIGVTARWIWHYVAGFLFWGSYAPEGVSPYWYSFTVNGAAALQTAVAVLIVVLPLTVGNKKLFLSEFH
ncbi:MAG: energy-coupled thiamine transporter ThiT [Eubacteriales bacterium]|nr:energy-coupled thiamine transporter ThiT [Eubacteriales bacterium]